MLWDIGSGGAKERYVASGEHLMRGLKLSQQFMGTDQNDHTRLMSDFGSTLYVAAVRDSKQATDGNMSSV